MTVTAKQILSESPVERAMVARGWADIDLVERMGSAETRRQRVATLRSDIDRAQRWYTSPGTTGLPAGLVALYESESNVTRYRRVVDYLTPGERVYEVGIGHGFLATMMLREGQLGGYRGVDFDPYCVSQTAKMLANNGLADIGTVAEKNLYEVTREDIEAIDATLLVCCEVIEHVADAEKALSTLARALPEGTDLLFSVPLIGRLEGVWGHSQIFGAKRIHDMLAQAGLVAHHVEVLHDTWAVVLASTGSTPSPRAAKVLEAIGEIDTAHFMEPPFREMINHAVTSLERVDSSWTKRVKDAGTAPCRVQESIEDSPLEGLRISGTPSIANAGTGKSPSAYAGVAFAVPEGTVGARIQVDLADPGAVQALRVDWSRGGERIGRWVWKPSESQPKAAHPTFLICGGRKSAFFKRAPGSEIEGADTVEVHVQAEGSQPIDFRILRWAWVS